MKIVKKQLIGLLVVGSALACGAGLVFWHARDTRPNVLLMTLDTLRADALGCYGSATPTPFLDSLAAHGVRFDQASTSCPQTLPAHTGLMTSRYNEAHGVRINAQAYDGRFPTVAGSLRAAGYATGAVVGAFVLTRDFGLADGFDSYDDAFDPRSSLKATEGLERRAEEVTRRAMSWLDEHRDRRFFLWVHYYDPHDPYEAPPAYAGRHPDNPYAAEVEYLDAEIGRLLEHLDRLGLRDDTVIIVVGDHGEGLDDHGEPTHGYFLYQTTLRVPLIMSWPERLEQGVTVASPVHIVDVAPTILELAAEPAPEGFAGLSLVGVDGRSASGRSLFAETVLPSKDLGLARLKSVREGRWKYVRGPEPELYDLSLDPHEQDNVLARNRDVADRLDAAIREHVRASFAEPASDGSSGLGVEDRDRLMALGYLGGGIESGPPGLEGELDLEGGNPMAHVREIQDIQDAMRHLRERSPARAAELLRAVAEVNPRNVRARIHLVRLEMELGAPADALRWGLEALALVPRDLSMLDMVTFLRLKQGAFEEAVELTSRAIEVSPDHAEAWQYQGRALFSLERLDEAEQAFRRAAELAPRQAQPYLYLADIEIRRGRPYNALALLERGLKIDPSSRAMRGRLDELRRSVAH